MEEVKRRHCEERSNLKIEIAALRFSPLAMTILNKRQKWN